MKVFCINSSGWYQRRSILWGLISFDKRTSGPHYGDILTVTNEYYEDGGLYYELLEWPPNDGDHGFEASCFIPIQDSEQTEESYEIPESISLNS